MRKSTYTAKAICSFNMHRPAIDAPIQAGVDAPVQSRIWHWTKTDLPPHVNPENQLLLKGPALQAKSPLQMLLAHFYEECFHLLTLESNRFRIQQGRTKMKPVDVQEIKTVFGMCLFMFIVELPTRRMYWSPLTRQPVIADAMTLNRFEEILSVIHINDNVIEAQRGSPGYDRLYKVRPLLNLLTTNFASCAEPETYVSVDEQMIPFKGRHSMKVYMLKKPKKWGYKAWILAGYVHKFEFAGDSWVTDSDPDIAKVVGKAGSVVLILLEQQPADSYVYFDNYFSSPELLIELDKEASEQHAQFRHHEQGNVH